VSSTKKCLLIVPFIALTVGSVSCSRSAASYVARGNKLYAEGQDVDASLNYRKALQKDPQFGEAYYRMAFSELRQGHIAVAYGAFYRATQLQPENMDAVSKFGDLVLYTYQRNPNRPKPLYDLLTSLAGRLEAKDAKSIDALRFRAYLALLDRKTEEALRQFRLADSIKPMQPEIVLPLAQILISQKQAPEAEKLGLEIMRTHSDYLPIYGFLYSQYLNTNRPAEAEQILKDEVAAFPKLASSYLELANYYARVGKTGEMTATLQRLLDQPKNFPQARFQLGEFYEGIGKPDEALRQYTEGAKADGGKTEIYQKKIVQLLTNNGKADEALNVLSGILQRHPGMPDALAQHAMVLADSGSVQKANLALKELNEGIAKNPNNALLHYALGRVQYAKRDLNGARKELQQAIRLNPRYAEARLLLADISLQLQHPAEALSFAEQARALEPDNPQAILVHASSLMALARYADARSELDALLQQQPNRQDAQLQLGLLMVAEKRFKEADEIFRKLFKPGSKDARPLEGLIRADLAQNQFDGSIRLLQDELHGAPSTAQSDQLRTALASIAIGSGKYDLALEQYQILATAHPEVGEFHRRIGLLYKLKGDLQASLASLQKAQALTPDAATEAELATALQLTGRKQEAIDFYRKSLALRPKDPVVCNNLAFLLADTGSSLDEALSLAKTAEAQKPGDPVVSDTVAWVYYKQGLTDSAYQILKNLTGNDKNAGNPAFLQHYAAVLIAKGDAAEARLQLQKALASNPSKPEEEKIRELLRRLG
jgi:tetratricopeptide (TPR) repeat protein